MGGSSQLQIVGAWREGYRFVIRPGATLPNACVKCGQPPVGRSLRKTYHWQPSGLFRLIPFPGSLIAMLVGLLMGRRITLDIPLCAIHRRKRRVGLLLTWFFCAPGVVAIGWGLNWAISTGDQNADNAPYLIFTGISLMLVGALCFICAGRLLSAKEIDETTATFSGAGTRFLQLLPASPNVSP